MKRGLTPYPYFGSKALVADVLWDAFGHDVPNFVDPFAGSCSVLFARPTPGKIETVNDAHAYIPNFLRAVRDDPAAVAEHASWPVSEIDMHARHTSLIERADEAWRERLRDDPKHYDAEMAGWWVWGASIWIGSGWCDSGHRNAGTRQRPALGGGKKKRTVESMRKRPAIGGRGPRPNGKNGPHAGVGIFRGRLPHLIGPNNQRNSGDGSGVGYGRGIFASGRREDLLGYFRLLSERLERVRITCGDWTRVVTPAVTVSHGLTAVLLDPPYGAARTERLYANDAAGVARAASAWAIEQGESKFMRIALCGYEGEHDMPASWRCFAWKTNGGYGNQDGENDNASKERIWFSPWCLGGARVSGPLFERLEATT